MFFSIGPFGKLPNFPDTFPGMGDLISMATKVKRIRVITEDAHQRAPRNREIEKKKRFCKNHGDDMFFSNEMHLNL